MRKFFIAVCFLATVFNGFATVLGLCVAAKVRTLPGYVFGCVEALIIIAIMISTRDIWRRQDMFYKCMRAFWVVALIVNIVAVLLAGFNHIILEKPLSDSINQDWQQLHTASLMQVISVLVLGAFLTGAPVAVSYLWHTYFEDDDEFDTAPAVKVPPKFPA